MVPYYRPDRGSPMPMGGTAHGDECVCCGKRYTIRYIIDGKNYCGDHAPGDPTAPRVPPVQP